MSQSWEKSDEAIAYIKSLYEGKSQDLASEITLNPNIGYLTAA
ncbi:hypothetical protein H1P_6720002 [Hyella patelloides LEGE 07179]|uniref:Uncharacterized protein n=1 Tax=Hyella patelloides LEGE 07179 TaxID=945734 RepID=A0A563W2U9_9CYAN|nr:hypothetical protein [Hyella patelloides]VEP18011.1 hypothetical protein H1P_6720002 [Hyella patelloides LEGE 07179]